MTPSTKGWRKAAVLALSATLAGTALAAPLPHTAAAYVEHARLAPVVSIARISPDGVEYAIHGDDAVTREMRFEIGSVTKVFTGILLADLVIDGTVTLETTVGDLIPAEYRVTDAVASITLHELATHTSGLPRMPGGPQMIQRLLWTPADPYAGTTTAELFTDLARITEAGLDGRGESHYSNFGMAVLGRLLEAAGGDTYEALIERRVLDPIGLEGMAFTNQAIGAPDFIDGHRANGVPTAQWRLDAYAPAGGLVAHSDHMVRFLQAAMTAEAGSAMALSLERGPGWAHSEHNGQRVVWHNGRTGGFFAFVGFVPESGAGLVLLTNAGHNGTGIALDLLTGGEAELTRPEAGLLSIGFTILFSLLAPILMAATLWRPKSRLHALDATVSAAFMVALVWKLGAWTTVPIALWYAALTATVVLAALMIQRTAKSPWVPPGKPWITAGKAASATFLTFALWWVLWKL